MNNGSHEGNGKRSLALCLTQRYKVLWKEAPLITRVSLILITIVFITLQTLKKRDINAYYYFAINQHMFKEQPAYLPLAIFTSTYVSQNILDLVASYVVIYQFMKFLESIIGSVFLLINFLAKQISIWLLTILLMYLALLFTDINQRYYYCGMWSVLFADAVQSAIVNWGESLQITFPIRCRVSSFLYHLIIIGSLCGLQAPNYPLQLLPALFFGLIEYFCSNGMLLRTKRETALKLQACLLAPCIKLECVARAENCPD